MNKKLDILAFGAHPDDVELSAGGTLVSLSKKGYKTGIVDLTKGELGTRGSVKIRSQEAKESSKVLGLTIRENLALKDGEINPYSEKAVLSVIKMIRKYRPSIIFAPYFNDRHPDHSATGHLLKRAHFLSGLLNYRKDKLKDPPHRAFRLFFYMQTYTFEPKIIYDISDSFEEKMKAILCFSSQFYNPNSREPETFISTPEFLDYIKMRSGYFGFLIGCKYGEPFYCEENINYNFDNYLVK